MSRDTDDIKGVIYRGMVSNSGQLHDLHAWRWNWRSRYGLRDFFRLCLYLSYRDDLYVVSWGFLVSEFIPTIAVRVTITRDLETEGHVTVYMTFVFSACICPTEMIVFCFVRFLVQGIHSNYCQLRDLHAWSWKPKITSLSRSRHGLHDFCFFCLYLSYRDDCFLFRKVFWFRKFILTIANCVIFTLDLENRKSRHCLRDFLFCQVVKACRPWRDFTFQGHTWWSRKWQ